MQLVSSPSLGERSTLAGMLTDAQKHSKCTTCGAAPRGIWILSCGFDTIWHMLGPYMCCIAMISIPRPALDLSAFPPVDILTLYRDLLRKRHKWLIWKNDSAVYIVLYYSVYSPSYITLIYWTTLYRECLDLIDVISLQTHILRSI